MAAHNFKDLTGLRFGRWTVLERSPRMRPDGVRACDWRCRCECGSERVVIAASLTHGRSKSCGCHSREVSKTRATKHGQCSDGFLSGVYRSYCAMKQRCLDKASKAWPRYGGRGITISPRWLGEEGFKNFLADMGERPSGHTLDRFPNNKGNYEPGNCRWATQRQQAQNMTCNVLSMPLARAIRDLRTNGIKHRAIAEKVGVSVYLVESVLCRGGWAEPEEQVNE